jgi:hypothetical protein
MAWCIEVRCMPGRVYNVLGKVEEWDQLTARAAAVDRVESLTGWGIWSAIYRVKFTRELRIGHSVVQGITWHHYFVAEDERHAGEPVSPAPALRQSGPS